MNILIEATGSLTSGYLIKSIKQSGHKVIGSDISSFNHGKALCDDFIIMPKVNDPLLWEKTMKLLDEYEIDIVIPSFDETLLHWSEIKQELYKKGIYVIVSEYETVTQCQDKWNTYNFFKSIDIDTPKTSLNADYKIVKPRLGRGGSGIFKNDFKQHFLMEGLISQEEIRGEEYTVDVFFSKDHEPIYIVPRIRLDVKEGKSTKGEVVKDTKIDQLITKISQNLKFTGPVNFQLFKTKENKYIFIEINPRIAGGMALGIEATENWIKLIVDNIVNNKEILFNDLKPVKYGLKMVRYYEECFI